MCGIAGFIGISEDGLIERMLKTMHHRGPDALNYWVDPVLPLALGHVRLSILDLTERGRQPMWDDTGRFCIMYNGEICLSSGSVCLLMASDLMELNFEVKICLFKTHIIILYLRS